MITPKLRETMAATRSAAKFATLAVEKARWNTVSDGGEMLRERWADLSGKRSAYRALWSIIAEKTTTPITETEDELRAAFMTYEEVEEFVSLTYVGAPVPLFRFVSQMRRTGWFTSRDDAWAVWAGHRPPTALEKVRLIADEHHFLAVKKVAGRSEIVLHKFWAKLADALATREMLP